MFRVCDRFSQNYKMRTWSGFHMTRHIYIYQQVILQVAIDLVCVIVRVQIVCMCVCVLS